METMPIYPREKTRAESEVEAQLNSPFDAWWERVGLPPQHFVYLLFDQYGHLLYCGITNNLRVRLADHYSSKPWINEVVKVEVERHDTREESKARETQLIKQRGPVWNVAEAQHLANAVSYFTRKLAEECHVAPVAVSRLLEMVNLEYENTR